MREMLFSACVRLVALSFVSLAIFAQSGGGTIQGTVKDPSGAVIAGARLSIVHTDTGRATDTESNAGGFYVTSPIGIGKYRIRVETPGMKVWQTEINLETGSVAVVDPVLQPGQVSETIQVTDTVPLVNTTDATDASTLDFRRIQEIPLNGRNLNTLLEDVTPGVESINDVNGGVRVSGLMTYSTDYVQDGASANNREFGGSAGLQGLESIGEVRVETSTSSAKYTRPVSVIVNTRSGTNTQEKSRNMAPDGRNPCHRIQTVIGASRQFVAMMSQGTSGDQMWMDYGQPKSGITLDAYAEGVTRYAHEAYQKIEYRDWAPLRMAETTLSLRRRTPDEQRLAWAREITAPMNGQSPKNQQEVYALEQIYLHEQPVRELKLQAVRIGDLGITAIPNEVFAITGLKLKAQSPSPATFNIELANGAEGYIPPPEQHKLGGYTTWPARTAALEVQAEPKIVETLISLLEKVFGKPRYPVAEAHGPYAQAVLASKPAAYWRFSEFNGPLARDSSGRDHHGTYEDGVAFYLSGPRLPGQQINPATHFAGGRMTAPIDGIPNSYSVEMWFWNGLPNDVRGVTGYPVSRGAADALGIGGIDSGAGKLIFAGGLEGKTEIQPKTWNHVVMVRDRQKVRVFLNGSDSPEIAGEVPGGLANDPGRVFVGGRHDSAANFEGKIDEVAVYDRALTQADIAEHFRAGRR